MSLKNIVLINLALPAIFLMIWCVWDYCAVNAPDYPENIHRFDWLLNFVLIIPFGLNMLLLPYPGAIRILLSFLIAIAVSALTLLAIFFIGINFHLSIGGTL